jgi:hypothetical protein
LRDAERAKKALTGFKIKNREIDIHFSIPKEEDLASDKCDKEKFQVEG